MGIKRKVTIGSAEVELEASAAVPRLYRLQCGRDIFRDLVKLQSTATDSDEAFAAESEVYENLAYVMAKHANPNIADDINEWLSGFNMLDFYSANLRKSIIELWGLNTTQAEKDKKKSETPTEN